MSTRRFRVKAAAEPFATESTAGTSSTTSPSYSNIDWLEPVYASVVANGEIGELRLIAVKHPEDVLEPLPSHTPIQLIDNVDPTDPKVVFDGVVVKHHLTIGGEQEKTEIIAYNNGDYLLHRIAVHGQYRRDYDTESAYWTAGYNSGALGVARSAIIQIDTPTIFNPDGAPNATEQTYFVNDGGASGDNTLHLFEAPFRNQKNAAGNDIKAVPWQLSWAVQYLLNLHKTSWALDPSSFSDVSMTIFSTNGDPVISNINLEGKSLLESLNILLSPHNYIFWVESNTTGSIKHRIKFAYRGDTTFSNTVRLEARGTMATDSFANLINCDLTIDTTGITNTLYSYGDRISFTTWAHTDAPSPSGDELYPLDLQKGWKTADLTWATNTDGTVNSIDTTFRKNYCHPDLISPDITGKPYGVGRLFIVNLGETPDHIIEALGFDMPDPLTGTFDTNSVDPRRLERPEIFNRNSAGGLLRQEDIQVEMSFDAGDHWDVVEKDWYRILPDKLGIVFTNPKLERLGIHFKNNDPGGIGYWQALKDDKLQIRILCAVKSDQRVFAVRSNVGDNVPLATEAVYLNDGYRRLVYNSMLSSSIYYTNYAPYEATQDDTDKLTDITNQQAKKSDRLLNVGTMSVVLDSWNEYHPGMVITAIESRIDFDPAPTILRTIYDFPNQHVHLVLDSRIVKSIIGVKKVLESDRNAAHLGVQGIRQLAPTEANKVPFVPGDQQSFIQSVKDALGEGE